MLLDEAWFFLSSVQGRALLNRVIRLGRAFNATVLVATQRLADLGDLSELFGVYLLFGQETEAEARAGLVQIGLDSEAPLASRLTEYRQGLCLMRDLDGRVGEVQVDLVFERAAGRARQHAEGGARREGARRAPMATARAGRARRSPWRSSWPRTRLPGAATDVWGNVGPASPLGANGLFGRYPLSNYSLDQHFDAVSASLTGGVDVSGVPPMIAYFLASILWLLTSFLANLLITLFSFAFTPGPRQRLGGNRRGRGAGAGLPGDPLDLRQRLRRALARPGGRRSPACGRCGARSCSAATPRRPARWPSRWSTSFSRSSSSRSPGRRSAPPRS